MYSKTTLKKTNKTLKMSVDNAPMTLKTTLADNLETVQLERYVTVQGNDVRRRARCPVIGNEIDPELAMRVYDEFVDIASPSRLSLTNWEILE